MLFSIKIKLQLRFIKVCHRGRVVMVAASYHAIGSGFDTQSRHA